MRSGPDGTRQVLEAVEARSRSLAHQDSEQLRRLMHPQCVWTSHAGRVLDRDEYVRRNTTEVSFAGQRLDEPRVRLVGDVAIVTGTVVDTMAGGDQVRLLVTLTWIRDDGSWRLLAGHAGPRL